jgi:lactate 2-monooxygenase
VSDNFGDFQLGVYADAVNGVNSRYPFDFRSIERKASEALPDWVYRYVSAAAGDGRTQRANIDATSISNHPPPEGGPVCQARRPRVWKW